MRRKETEEVREFMRMNVKGRGRKERPKIYGWIQLRVIWKLLLYAYKMWKIETRGGLGIGWPTRNC